MMLTGERFGRSTGKIIRPSLLGSDVAGASMSLQKTPSKSLSNAYSPESVLLDGNDDRAAVIRKVTPISRDASLLDGLRNGDPLAYEELIRKFGSRLLATARRYLRSEADACDALQDSFLCAFKSIHTFNGDAQLSTWLHRIVVNSALMQLRARRHEGDGETVPIDRLLPRFDDRGNWSDDESVSISAQVRLEASETRSLVRRCINLLPDSYRLVLILRDIEELDTGETARLLNLTHSNVKVRLHRARQALKILLENQSDLHIE